MAQIHAAGQTGGRSPGLDAAIAAYLDENPPAGGGGASNYYALPASSGAITLNPTNGDRQGVTLTGPATFTFEGDGQFALALNRSTSGHEATFEGVTWETPPNIAAGTNVLSFVKFGDQWYGFCSGIGFDTEPPTTPGNLTQGTTTSSSVTVGWTASTDNVAIDGYEISIDGGAWFDVFKVTSYTLSALTSGQTYNVRVRARDIKFNYSTPASLDVVPSASGDTTPPTVGTLASSAITDTGFTLTVSGASDAGGLNATPYAFSTDNGTTWSAWQASATYNATGLTADTAYQARHKVRDVANNESTGTAITVTTAAAAFSPADIADLDIWLKSESLDALTDSDPVTSWADSSGSGNTFTNSSGSMLPVKTTIGGFAAAEFDATGKWLQSSAAALQTEVTGFAVVRRTATAHQGAILTASLRGWSFGIGDNSNFATKIVSNAGTADSVNAANNSATLNAWAAAAARYSDTGDTLSIAANSATPVSVTATKQITDTGYMLIGNRTNSVVNGPFVGQIAEVLRYTRALSDGERSQVLAYLMSKYGIA